MSTPAAAASTASGSELRQPPRPPRLRTPATASATPAAPPAPARHGSAPTGGAARFRSLPHVRAQLSSTVMLVTLQADNMTDLAAVPVKIQWDPKILRLEKIAPGSLLTKDGNVKAPTLDIRNDTGEASVEINRSRERPASTAPGR